MMRHADIGTTGKYYVTLDADAVGDELWGRDWESDNSLGNKRPKTPKGLPTRQRWKPLTEIALLSAEGKGVEPSTACAAPDFESGC